MARSDKPRTNKPQSEDHPQQDGPADEDADGQAQAITDAPAPAGDDEDAGEVAAEPPLSAFAAAIERKKVAGQARSAHLDHGAKVGGATSNHKTSRTFRRKSG